MLHKLVETNFQTCTLNNIRSLKLSFLTCSTQHMGNTQKHHKGQWCCYYSVLVGVGSIAAVVLLLLSHWWGSTFQPIGERSITKMKVFLLGKSWWADSAGCNWKSHPVATEWHQQFVGGGRKKKTLKFCPTTFCFSIWFSSTHKPSFPLQSASFLRLWKTSKQ